MARSQAAPVGTQTFQILPINFAAAGNNIVIPAPGPGKTIRVHGFYFVVAGATLITYVDGVITDAPIDCPTAGWGKVLDPNDNPWFVGPINTAFIMNSSNAVQVSGRIYYSVVGAP